MVKTCKFFLHGINENVISWNDKNPEVTAGVDAKVAAASSTHELALDLIVIVMILLQACL